jgi:hypothetical protein
MFFQFGFSLVYCSQFYLPEKKPRLVANHRQTLSHNVISSTPRHEQGLNSGL